MLRRLNAKLSFLQEVLLATAAGLSLLTIVQVWLVLPPSGPTARAAATVSTQSHAGNEQLGFALPPRNSLRAFVERPLFETSRRSAEAYAPAETAVQADVALIGVIIAPYENIAILRQHSSTEPVRARIGDAIGAWTVAQITQTSVLLRNNDAVQWVSLREGG
jgi:hypothetical protein